jgi:hypothetical protein
MQARVGTWVVVEGPDERTPRKEGRVVALTHADGSPPYWVRRLDDHRGLGFPGPDCRLLDEAPHARV